SSVIWRPARARRRPCSITSMRNCRPSMPASGRNWSKRPMPELTLVEAVNLALARAMQDDDNVVILGEDVGVNGGVFRATAGLQRRFGPERVVDTPLAELLISGLCVGMAAEGLRPVGEVEDDGEALPLDVAFVLRGGRDVTLIAWGAMLKETLAAAEALAGDGIAAEVIDLATLKPYDEETILASVAKTGRCVIVHEAA